MSGEKRSKPKMSVEVVSRLLSEVLASPAEFRGFLFTEVRSIEPAFYDEHLKFVDRTTMTDRLFDKFGADRVYSLLADYVPEATRNALREIHSEGEKKDE